MTPNFIHLPCLLRTPITHVAFPLNESGHKVAAVYALLDSNYKRGSPGWEHVRHVRWVNSWNISHHATHYCFPS